MNKYNKYFYIFTLIVSIITFLIILFPFENNVYEILRIIFGSIFILFIPWYFITHAFFDKKEIDFLERFALSFAFSISVIPLLTFYFNLIWLKITDLNVFFISLWVIISCILYIYLLPKFKKWAKIS